MGRGVDICCAIGIGVAVLGCVIGCGFGVPIGGGFGAWPLED